LDVSRGRERVAAFIPSDADATRNVSQFRHGRSDNPDWETCRLRWVVAIPCHACILLYQHLLASSSNLPSVTWKHSGRPVSAQLAPLIRFTSPGAAVKILAWTASVSEAWSPRRPLIRPDLREMHDGGIDLWTHHSVPVMPCTQPLA
jgi:hypothetical protein